MTTLPDPERIEAIERELRDGPLKCDCAWAAEPGKRPCPSHFVSAVAAWAAKREARLREEMELTIVGVTQTCEAHRADRDQFTKRAAAQLAAREQIIANMQADSIEGLAYVELRDKLAERERELACASESLSRANEQVAERRDNLADSEREVERLNKWADSFTDIALNERRCAEAAINELRATNAALISEVERLNCGRVLCTEHGRTARAWGCPDCVVDLRTTNTAQAEELGLLKAIELKVLDFLQHDDRVRLVIRAPQLTPGDMDAIGSESIVLIDELRVAAVAYATWHEGRPS